MDELLNGPVRNMAAAVRQGQVTATALTTAFLDRVERVNQDLNAFVCSNAGMALKQAAKADAELKSGATPGPLHGVPMTIKDSLDTLDTITTWGTSGRRETRPGRDATCVARLRSAGAILLGKTNTPEFTLAFRTDNDVYGQTNNPFDTNRTPGGSSGGAAALIAAGATPFDVGTDTGGSIRLPAHFCGITGIKPTTGRIPCTGNALPSAGVLAPLSQPGPMAKQVDDLHLLLPLMSGPDLRDPYSVDASWHDPNGVDIRQLRFGYHTDNGIAKPTGEISATVLDIVRMLRDQQLNISEARPPGLEMAHLIYGKLFVADGSDTLLGMMQDSRTENLSKLLQGSLATEPVMMEAAEFAYTMTMWDNYRSSMLGYFENHDVLICPVNARTAHRHDEQEKMQDYSYTLAYNLTGWPSLVLRAGTDQQGLPIGIQIIARPFREDVCLAVGLWLEALIRQQLGNFPVPAINAFSTASVQNK
ncbi:MAG: amidase [Pseudomonadales bacterium]|nr:amidase [Pseudomonadales bacterium]